MLDLRAIDPSSTSRTVPVHRLLVVSIVFVLGFVIIQARVAGASDVAFAAAQGTEATGQDESDTGDTVDSVPVDETTPDESPDEEPSDAVVNEREPVSAWWWIVTGIVAGTAAIGLIASLRRRRVTENWFGQAATACHQVRTLIGDFEAPTHPGPAQIDGFVTTFQALQRTAPESKALAATDVVIRVLQGLQRTFDEAPGVEPAVNDVLSIKLSDLDAALDALERLTTLGTINAS